MITFSKMGTNGFGRLGNQMFQYALVFSVAKKLNFSFGVPYKNKSNNDYENFCLDEGFEITANDSSAWFPKNKFIEKNFGFDSSVFEVQDDTDFVGFFQSEKYFREFKKQIKEEFKFKSEIIEKSNELLSKFDCPLASICIRRGDYLDSAYKKIHYTCGLNYFLNCLHRIPQDAIKLIITDDCDWAKEKFSKKIANCRVINQDLNNPKNKFIILRIMSMCDYHIISNSSFSWWGAWLSNSKKILAPKKWFGKDWNRGSWNDIYCDQWQIVDDYINFL